MSNINFDNKEICILDHGDQELRDALRFTFKMMNIDKVYGYFANSSNKTLSLSNSQFDSGVVKFPFPVSENFIVEFVLSWLENADYGEFPDFDGTAKKGWRITNSHSVLSRGLGICNPISIEAVWVLYGK